MIVIIDFGSQVTQLIARRIRELSVYCEIIPWDANILNTKSISDAKALILSGGPDSTRIKKSPTISKKIFHLGIPILGICYGHQLICKMLGGKISKSKKREFGKTTIRIKSKNQSPLLKDLFKRNIEEVWMSHGDAVTELPQGFVELASSDTSSFSIVGDAARKFFGVQFHPEVFHTVNGKKFLENFVNIADIKRNWTPTNITESLIERLRNEIGDEKVICGLSGGVDSTVTALLLQRAINKNLTCIFVDNGLLRKQEAYQIKTLFKKHFKIKLISVNAKNYFLEKLKGVTNPEKKRKIIGKLFIDVFESEAKKLKKVSFLAQGTLYPDVIESASVHGKSAATIKSHHNVGGLPKKMCLKLVEPLKTLFKDEVRKIGSELKLKKTFLERHPFPGPGLAIRCPGEITAKKLSLLREADHIFVEQLKRHKLYNYVWQALVILLPVKSVGVMGDARTHEYSCVLRAVNSTDGMTADFSYFKKEFLSETSNKIINEVKGINRVLFDITSKPPGTIEWE
ncbi:glutamine-hydrolyzing GMP synthase [Paracoccaceae bacterium]|nr:glutamine-hydrolyzing GMP synthase [Paracoccaceae bacterium]